MDNEQHIPNEVNTVPKDVDIDPFLVDDSDDDEDDRTPLTSNSQFKRARARICGAKNAPSP